jgi:hypothetical protein
MSEQLIESLKILVVISCLAVVPFFLFLTGKPLKLTVTGLNKLEIVFKADSPFF